MNKLILSICIVFLLNSFANAGGAYNNSVDFGNVTKGPIITKTFNNIQIPATPFYIQAVQVFLINKTSNQPFDHDSIVISAIDFVLDSKKIMSFTTSNILTPLSFPSPYTIPVDGPISISASMITTNVESQDMEIQYIFKYTTDNSNTVKLTRTATSVLANFSSFNVPQGSGGYTISNNIVWQQNSQATGFLASVSPGIISLTFSEVGGAVVCNSTPTYTGKFLEEMSLCPGVFTLNKGSTYTTTAVYDNSILRKGVFANWGFYIGFPRSNTTSTTSTSTGPATTGGKTTGPATTGGKTTGPATTGGKTSGPTSGPHTTSGGKTTSPQHTTSGGKTSGPSSGPSSTTNGNTDSSQSGSSHTDSSQTGSSQTSGSHNSQDTGSSNTDSSSQTGQTTGNSQTGQTSATGGFTTTNGNTGGTSGSHQSGDSTGNNPAGSTGYTVSSGSSGFLNWNPSRSRKIEIY